MPRRLVSSAICTPLRRRGADRLLPAMALIQPLHGITFALLHLGCMQRLAESVPPRLAAAALTVYGTLGIGAATTVWPPARSTTRSCKSFTS